MRLSLERTAGTGERSYNRSWYHYVSEMAVVCEHVEVLTNEQALAVLDKVPIATSLIDKSMSRGLRKALRKSITNLAGDFYRLNYSYGDLLVEKGSFKPPHCCASCDSVTAKLHFPNVVPLAVILEHDLEVFRVVVDDYHGKLSYRTVSVGTRGPGELIGLFENLRPLLKDRASRYGTFHISAGNRSVHFPAPNWRRNELAERLGIDLPKRRASDVLQYTGNPHTPDKVHVASDWHFVSKATAGSAWRSSIMILPPCLLDVPLKSASLAVQLATEAWGQSQDAIEAFVEDGEPQPLVDPKPIFAIHEVSAPAVIEHLCKCIAGNALLWSPPQDERGGPFFDFMKWVSTQSSKRSTNLKEYPPVLMIPQSLNIKDPNDWGIFSFVHPLTPGSLKFADRNVDTTRQTEGFPKVLRNLEIAKYVIQHPRADRDTTDALSLDRVKKWLSEKIQLDIPAEATKISRDVLGDYLTITSRVG